MRKTMSLKQLTANRLNAGKSTGPKTVNGKAVAKMNALKHGILSREVVVRGLHIKESRRDFAALHRRFFDELAPVGPVEEMLVDQIVTAHWRLRRALTAESGEIALSVDGGQWNRKTNSLKSATLLWEFDESLFLTMRDSAFGNRFVENQLRRVIASVETEGDLTEAAIQEVMFRGKPYWLTEQLEKLRQKAQPNPEGLDETALREKRKASILAHLRCELNLAEWQKDRCEERERKEEESRQAAAALPSLDTLEKIMRYETKLERQLYRAMAQLERLQRIRQGEAVPPPVSVAVA